MADYVDEDAAMNEGAVLAAVPAIVTALLKISYDTKILTGPYLNAIVIMIALNYVAFYLQRNSRWNNKALQTRLAIDLASMGGTIYFGNTYYPLTGPPEPNSLNASLMTFAGIVCIVATVRGFIWLMALGQNFIDDLL